MISPQDISSFVAANVDNPKAIADAAAKFGLSASDIAAATGYTPAQQSSFFQTANITPAYSGLENYNLINQAYKDIGITSPDAPGRAHWEQQLQTGAIKPEDFQKTFLQAASGVTDPKYAENVRLAQQQIENLNRQKIIDQAYQSVGVTAADAPGKDFWQQQLQSGAVKPEDFQKTFLKAAVGVTDPLYKENVLKAEEQLKLLAPTKDQAQKIVDTVYESIGVTDPNAPGKQAYVEQIASGKLDPKDFPKSFYEQASRFNDPKYAQNVTAAQQLLTDLNRPATIERDGQSYDTRTVLNLASQIIPNLGQLSGGIFGTRGESVGFTYDQAKQILGRDPSAGEQVVLDMAKELIGRGVTDLSQIKLEDMLREGQVSQRFEEGSTTPKYMVSAFNPYIALDESAGSAGINRELTPAELARVQSRQVRDEEGNFYTQYFLPDISVGKVVKTPTQTLGYTSATDPYSIQIGKTYSGPGMTGYNMIVNPTTGKLQFTTYGQDTGQGQLISQALTVASFVPGVQPFAVAANAAFAISQGNYLGAIASVASMGGYTNVATAANVASAIQNNNPLGVVTALSNNPTIASSVGNINVAGNITFSDVTKAANLANAISKEDWVSAAQIGGQLSNSSDLQTAAAAARVVQAISTGNIGAAVSAVKGLDRTLQAANNVTNPDVTTKIVEVVNRDVTGGADTAKDKIVSAALANGASEEEANDAAEAISQVQQAFIPVSDTTVKTADSLKTEIEKSIEKVDLEEFAGFDDAAARTIERNTLKISNTEADTPQEAAALAAARGYTAFNFGGETYQVSATAADIAKQVTEQNVAAQDTFANAYQTARNQLGPGQIFTWNGKQYSTDTREENPSLAAASDQIRAAQMGVANGKGTYAGYDQTAVGDALSSLGTFDSFLNATTEDGQKIVVGDKISKDLITPLVRIFGLTTRATGELAESMAGSLMAMNVIDKDSALMQAANQLKKSSEFAVGKDIAQAEKNVFDRVSRAEGAVEKGKELFKAMWDNPVTIFTLPFNEGVQEIAPLLTGVGAAKWIGKIAGLTVSAGMNAAEAAGANYNETVAMAQKSGMSPEEAHAAGQKSALAAGTVAAVLGPVAELPFIKRAAGDAVGDAIGSTVKRSVTAAGREAVTEYPEEAIASIAADYFATGTFDPNKALTQATIASVTAGKTVGAFTATVDVFADRAATNEIISSAAIPSAQKSTVDQIITTTLEKNQDLADAGNKISADLVKSGINQEQANNIANTVVAEQLINSVEKSDPQSAFAIKDLNQAVGVDDKGNAITIGDVIGSSVTKKGNETFLAPDIVIGTNAKGGVLTVGDLTTIKGATTSAAANDSDVSKTVHQGDVAVTTTTNKDTGITKTTETNTKTDVTTEKTVGTDTQTTTVTDPKANTATRTEENLATNTKVTTTNDANTNTVTQTTVEPNTTTEVAVNKDTNVTTQTTTDTKTNTQTTVQTDPVSNVQVTTVVDGNTKKVVEETVTTVPPDWTPPIIDAPPVASSGTSQTSTRLTAPQLAQRQPGQPFMFPFEEQIVSDDDLTFKDPFISSRMRQEAFKGSLDPFLAKVESDQLLEQQYEPIKQAQAQEEAAMNNYFTYGVPVDINEVFNPVPKSFREMIPADEEGSLMAAAQGGLATPLMARGGLSSYAGGGLPVVAHSGKARVDFRQGAAVSGPGDGQSDDIPAMLADGEFVFPADVVAALGNGSTKAGSDKLYEMMHSIRAHHRSAKPKDLPPPAKKSPLDYLKKARR
jgi:hypothetical protein